MEVSGQVHPPAALPPGKELWYAVGWRMGGSQSQSGHISEEKTFKPPPRIETYYPIQKQKFCRHSELNTTL